MRDIIEIGSRKYGRRAVVFQCDCAVEAWRDSDEEYQGIFPVCAEYNLQEISIDSYLGVGLDETGNGDLVWFKTSRRADETPGGLRPAAKEAYACR